MSNFRPIIYPLIWKLLIGENTVQTLRGTDFVAMGTEELPERE